MATTTSATFDRIYTEQLTVSRTLYPLTWGLRGPGVQLLEANKSAKYIGGAAAGVLGAAGHLIGTAAAVWDIKINIGTRVRVGVALASRNLSSAAPGPDAAGIQFDVIEGDTIRFALSAAAVLTVMLLRQPVGNMLSLTAFTGQTMYPWICNAATEDYSATISQIHETVARIAADGAFELSTVSPLGAGEPINLLTAGGGLFLDGKAVAAFGAGGDIKVSGTVYADFIQPYTPAAALQINTGAGAAHSRFLLNGRLQLGSGGAGAFAFPGADGPAGTILATDGAGSIAFIPQAAATHTLAAAGTYFDAAFVRQINPAAIGADLVLGNDAELAVVPSHVYAAVFVEANGDNTSFPGPDMFALVEGKMQTQINKGMDTGTNGRVINIGPAATFRVLCHATGVPSSDGITHSFMFYLNGAPVAGSFQSHTVPLSATRFSVGLSSMVDMAQNDYIELWTATSNGDKYQVTDLNLTVERLL